MDDLHTNCTHEGLDMILSLSYKLYEAQLSAFDTADSKAGSIVGYVAIAASILGVSALGQANANLPRDPHILYWACWAFTVFTLAIVAALAVLWPRSAPGPPSAMANFDEWKKSGDLKTVENVVRGMDTAQRNVSSANKAKSRFLMLSFALVGLGFVFLAIMTIQRIVS